MTTVTAPARGRTTVDPAAVERIAAHALTEVDGVGGAARTMLGIAVGAGAPDRGARVSADVTGAETALSVRMSVAYPTSVRDATRRARQHLIDRVGGLTGLRVSSVDITVTELYRDAAPARRVT
ncbi:Asp23/Gls24 family envelope stress response protein [Actinophytocola sp. KF-1]